RVGHSKRAEVGHSCRAPMGRPTGSMKQLIEPMQVQITEQRRNHPALGSTLARAIPSPRLALATRFHDWTLQPHPDQLEHTPVHYSHAHTSQKLVMRNRIEIAFQVRVIHRLIPGLDMPLYLLQRLVWRAPRTEPIGAILEIRFEDRLQYQQGRHLN